MLSKKKLISYFEKGIKSENDLKIGTEHEKFIINKTVSKKEAVGLVSISFPFSGNFPDQGREDISLEFELGLGGIQSEEARSHNKSCSWNRWKSRP